MITLDIAQIPRPTPSLVAWQVRDVSAHEMGGLLRRVQAFTPLLIVAFLFALYGYTLGYGMYWDDYHFIRPWSLSETASVWVGSFDPNNIEPPYFRPLTSVTYALDGLIWGYNVFGSHLTNLFFYGVVAVLLYALLRRMGASWLLATATALFFCVVPINAASVVYISERGDSLVAIWVLAGMLFFDSYWRTARVRWLVGANVAFGLALCSKEIGTGLFLLFGLYVCAAAVGTATQTSPRTDRENSVAYIRRVAGEIWRIVTAGDARRRLISAFVPSLVLLLVYVGYRALVLPSFVNTYKANGNIFSAYASAVQWTFRAVPWSWGSLQPFTSALLAGALGATILFCRRSQLWPLFFFGDRVGVGGLPTSRAASGQCGHTLAFRPLARLCYQWDGVVRDVGRAPYPSARGLGVFGSKAC